MSKVNLTPYASVYQTDGDLKKSIVATGANDAFECVAQYNFMRSVGLRPHHRFLDLACGCLRGSIHLVDYLENGNFYAADITKCLLDAIPERVSEMGVKHKVNSYLIEDYNFEKLFKTKFDHILSVSLFTHLLPDMITPIFRGIRDILMINGTCWFTIYPTAHNDHEGDIGLSRYRKEFLIEKGKEVGLKIEDIDGNYLNPSPIPNYIERVNHPSLAQWVMKAKIA